MFSAIDLSILIVNYKTPKMTAECIASITQYMEEIAFEIIVIDNHSQDNSKSYILAQHPKVIWVDMSYNAGFARANNEGIRLARGKYILLLNSDTLLVDNSILKCIRTLDQRSDTVAVSAMQLTPSLTPHPFYEGFSDYFQRFFIVPLSFQKYLSRWIKATKYEDNQQVDWLVGAFLMVKKSAIEQVGMLDEDFFMYAEDIEWSYRLKKQGKLLLLKDCQFIHLEWGSNPERKRKKYTYINRFDPQIHLSNLVFIRKQFGVAAYIALMGYYWTMIPVVYVWKIAENLAAGKKVFEDFKNINEFVNTIIIFNSYFLHIISGKPYLYKVP